MDRKRRKVASKWLVLFVLKRFLDHLGACLYLVPFDASCSGSFCFC